MKKTIIIIVLIILLFQGICLVAFFSLKARVQKAEAIAICREVEELLKKDNAFQVQYGYVVSVQLHDNKNVAVVDDRTLLLPCTIEVQNGITYTVMIEVQNNPFSIAVYYDTIREVS